jgi:signal transduction histidine kinase
MFQRMHGESEFAGTGIGLAIVRKATERMGGRPGLESEPGTGSRFWIELPEAAEADNRAFLKDAA